jgi:cellulose synthase/poly-beta-1,6-N-acetylglucosamine synthase-like glycosyltransferase
MPIYTILIPLYKEVGNIASIIKAMILIDYPIEKLDIKIIIEADDLNMFKELMLLEIPKYFHIIKVPYSIPRTKPKALNYAMDYSFGEYVTIYDAEDRPEPSQLRKVLEQFNMLTSEYACIQAKLCFYNEDQNLLTKLFSIEYCLWFEYILQGLSALNLPVTLGGTSNHFKTEYLIKLGYWDAYNVTEDAELGIRIYSSGYKTHVIDSYTFEESPISIGNWIDQRSRWIKGFFQTFLIVLFRNNADIQLKWPQKITLYILLGFSSFGFCAMPWMLFAISKMEINYIILNISSANIFLSLLYIYFAAFFILKKKKGMVRNFKLLDICALIIWPCYFILHSIAAYKALWELAFKPFAWNKTQHGLND